MLKKKFKSRVERSLLLLLVLTLSIFAIGVDAADQWQSNQNGTVTDVATGLIWQQQDDNVRRTHVNALSYCTELSLGGSGSWRLPEIKELSSIVDDRVNNPSIDDAAFPNTNSNRHWSASSPASNFGGAWAIIFSTGSVFNEARTDTNYVRCVRSGQ